MEKLNKNMMQMDEEMTAAFWKGFQEGLDDSLRELDPGELERANPRKLYQERRSHKGDMRIYDYANDSLEVDLQKKEILKIQVSVITGDEIVRVLYQDNTEDIFDAGSLLFSFRMLNYVDYVYTLTGSRIQEWLCFVPDENGGAISYQRAKAFKGTPGFYMREEET